MNIYIDFVVGVEWKYFGKIYFCFAVDFLTYKVVDFGFFHSCDFLRYLGIFTNILHLHFSRVSFKLKEIIFKFRCLFFNGNSLEEFRCSNSAFAIAKSANVKFC